jgi:GTPase
MAAECSAKCSVLAVRDGHEGKVAEVLVRTAAEDDCVEVRIAVVGNVDAGKSSIIGTLTRGVLDNGRGLSRSYVFTHRHELETGRTSTISHQLMGFDAAGACVNYKLHQMSHSLDMADIVDASRKLVTFVDLCGHERYLKTTVRGMAGHAPDYAFIIVGANHGLTKMSREHLGVALALKLPLVFIVTKVDLAPDNILEQTLSEITRVAKLPGVKKLPLQVRSMDDVLVCARQYAQSGSDRVAPVFLVSSVTGQGLDLLRSFLNVLPPRTDWHRHISEPTECVIDDVFVVQGVGLVVSCLVTAGTVSVGDTLMLGPDGNGAFVPVTIKSIHAKRRPVQRVQAGCGASFALRRAVNRNFVRKGMVLCDPSRARAVWEFEADILVLQSQTTTIHGGYQPVVHVRSVRQSAKITALSSEVVRTGDRAKVRFRFMFRPEVVLEGQRVLFREGRTKGMGVITAVTDAVTGKTAVAPEETNSHSHSHSHTHAAHAAHVSNAPKTKAEKAAAYKLKR